jgi:flavin-dependent dehydrogenase
VSGKLTSTHHEPKHYAIAVRGYYKNVANIPPQTYELHFIKGLLPGYLWIFPFKNNTANVGFGLSSKIALERKINLRKELESLIKTHPNLKERFKDAELIGKIEGHGLPLASRKTTISGNCFMLCGDAASLIDPATGEGIGPAMISGRYAGWQAIKCFEQKNFTASFIKQYDKDIYRKLIRKSRQNYRYQQLILSNEMMFNFTLKVIKRSHFLLRLILGKNY